jgi:DNA-binding transcriptional MerR regulator
MEEISKKELLERTGISYGQLYRWKRERLIPEEWFVKKSAFTGQETFFPQEQILNRIEVILDLKDEYSLEEITKILESDISTKLSREQLNGIEGIDTDILFSLESFVGIETVRRIDAAFLRLVFEEARAQKISEADLRTILNNTLPVMFEQQASDTVCLVLSAADKLHIAFAHGRTLPIFDKGITVLRTATLADLTGSIPLTRKGQDNG